MIDLEAPDPNWPVPGADGLGRGGRLDPDRSRPRPRRRHSRRALPAEPDGGHLIPEARPRPSCTWSRTSWHGCTRAEGGHHRQRFDEGGRR